VLASLWRVDDLTTREFMAEFYGCLMILEPGPGIIAEALRRAQMRRMATHRHPAFWASFVLAGKP
jgi:CHAT domain-containing protein